MLELKITIDGTPFEAKTRNDIERVIDFVKQYLALTSEATPSPVIHEVAKPAPKRPPQKAPAARVSAFTSPYSVPMNNWIEKAWIALGRPIEGATGKKFFEAAVSEGFTSGAKKPIAAFTASIRYYPGVVKVGREGIETKFALLSDAEGEFSRNGHANIEDDQELELEGSH